MPSPAAAVSASPTPLHSHPYARRCLSPALSSVPFRALLKSTTLTPLLPKPRTSSPPARASGPAAATGGRTPASGGQMLVFVPPHPLIKHWVSVLRNEQTPCAIFKNAMVELGRLLIYEASRDWLPTITGEIESPVALASIEFVDPREPVIVIPILRAGLALAENASSVLPATRTYHLGVHDYSYLYCRIEYEGIRRDEATLQPSIYLNNLPDKLPDGSRVLVIDPMLATGGTIVAAIDLLVDRGITSKQIKVISAVAAPPALQKLSNKFPGLHVYTGTIDPEVNEKGFIVPGLGDAGDRSFAT